MSPRAFGAIMVQGTGSDVGKSLIVAGLCRAFRRRGLRVAPFKPQNMSNNAAVTADGGEIGRAQALQARAAGLPPSRHMNPVLLKPQSDQGAQIVLQGKVIGQAMAADYQALKPRLLASVLESFAEIGREADLVIVEGAGSAAEINLRPGDIANMGFATAADLAVLLVGDIDRGGVIAALVGTHALLPDDERHRIKGFIVNKFRGDPALFRDGMAIIAERTGWHPLGLLPWFPSASALPAEDSVSLKPTTPRPGTLLVAVPMLPHIANFDDFDPLAAESGVCLAYIAPGQPLPAGADLIILPGSKATRADLAFLRAQGWDIDLQAHVRQGRTILGLCGGYQMLGQHIADPTGVEGPPGTDTGLGLLAVDTVITADKTLRAVEGICLGQAVHGYEMHMGVTDGPDCRQPLLTLEGRQDGAIARDGAVMGGYLHGLFASDPFRHHFLRQLRSDWVGHLRYEQRLDETLDRLADHLEAHLDLDRLLAWALTQPSDCGKVPTRRAPAKGTM